MAKELLPNSVLQNGKYKIVKVLGGGSFGFTYKALAYVHDRGISGYTQVAVCKIRRYPFTKSDDIRSLGWQSSVSAAKLILFSETLSKVMERFT